MKLASLNSGRDGQLVVVDSLMQRYETATAIAPTLQVALDNWDSCAAHCRNYLGNWKAVR